MTTTTLPIPKYAIGDRVFCVGTTESTEELKCPDCLGTKRWAVKSPAGTEGEVECPRCNGRGGIALRARKHSVQELTIGSITAKTPAPESDWDAAVSYMCEETGIGSGSNYRESLLWATREEAETRSIEAARTEAARFDEGQEGKRRAELRYLSSYQLRDAAVIEAERKESETAYRLQRLLERIGDLSADTYMMSPPAFEDDEDRKGGGSLGLNGPDVRLLQEHLMSYDTANCAWLTEYRAEQEKCKC